MLVVAACPRAITDTGYLLSVSPATANLFVQDSVRLTASLVDGSGAAVPAPMAWSVDNAAVARVDSTGMVWGVGAGTASVQVSARGETAKAALTVSAVPVPPPGPSEVLVGAGDIASCTSNGDEATANLLDGIPGTVFTAGDNAYENGAAADYANCYNPSWGRHKSRTHPAPGNHEYNTAGAAGYFGYFGAAAGDPSTGYYSYTLGAWHIVVLNSNLAMNAGSTQETWLRADLAGHPATCTLALWHHPRFSSGLHGSSTAVQPLWEALYAAGADVVVVGHDHLYERFAPQTPSGQPDAARGIREFVVGTGGAGLYAFGTPALNSQVKDNTTHGVLKLTLYGDHYDWKFVPIAGSSFTDSGSGNCH